MTIPAVRRRIVGRLKLILGVQIAALALLMLVWLLSFLPFLPGGSRTWATVLLAIAVVLTWSLITLVRRELPEDEAT